MRAVIDVRSRNNGVQVMACSIVVWLCVIAGTGPLRAEPLDRQVAEWVNLMGGTVRLSGRTEPHSRNRKPARG